MTITTSTFPNVNIGTAPNDGTGDPLRTSFNKINENFNYINEKIWGNLLVDPPLITAAIENLVGESRFNLVKAYSILVVEGDGTITANSYYGNTFTVNTFTTNTFVANTTTNLTVTSNIIAGNIRVNGNLTGNGSTVISNVKHYVYSVAGSTLNTVLGPNTNITLSPISGNSAYTIISVGNATSFVSNIFYTSANTGIVRTFVFQNNVNSLATRYIVLPNNFNNKGVANITMSPGANVYMQFTAFDDTTSNVYVFVANN